MATLRVPDIVPSPTEDCQNINKAFQGIGTDEKALINILGHRNASQRRQIRDTYHQLYNEDLIHTLQSELSGYFGKAIILWTYEPAERDARLANEALNAKKKSLKHLQIILEIACASSPHHLAEVRKAYCYLYDRSLEEEIVATVGLPLRKILLSLVSSYRYDKEKVDPNVAKSEADTLYEATRTRQLDHDHVLYILGTRNFYQLKETFESYKLKYGNPISKDLKSWRNSELESLLRRVVLCIDSPEKHFAEVIGTSVIGLGTDEDSLTRAIVMRAEVDLMKVRGEYYNKYNTSMDNAVIDDTSGDYQAFLMTLLGAKI